MRRAGLGVTLACLTVLLPVSANPADPVRNLARVRLLVSTTAETIDITVAGATVASYVSTIVRGAPPVRSSQTGSTLRLSRNARGQPAEARFDVILSGVSSRGWVTWNIGASSDVETQLEVYSLADFDRPRLVDRFVATGSTSQFSSPALQLTAAGMTVSALPRLVLAHYYPWYTIESWRDPQMADAPLHRYSSDSQADVDEQVRQARSAGIDAFAVSWQGNEAGNGFNARRMRLVLDAARRIGLKAGIYTETYVANIGNSAALPIDPNVVVNWFTDIVDMFGNDPAYLRLNGRPVILVYAAPLLPQPDWNNVFARLRATGRNPLIIGHFSQSPLLESFDGEYQYTNILLSAQETAALDRTESLRVRTYHLLRPEDRRRIFMAAVTPGYDDTRLNGRAEHDRVDRMNSGVYDDQWKAAIDSGADWIVVTSWNEWFENTQIEPSERYGTAYLDRTRVWSSVFKRGTDRFR